MRYRIIVCLLIGLLIPLQISLWSDEGWPRLKELTELIQEQYVENEQMKQRNKILVNEVSDLRSGEAALEELARENLEMIKQDETLIRLLRLPRENDETSRAKQ